MFRAHSTSTAEAAWRQPAPRTQVNGDSREQGLLHRRLSGALAAVFEASEDENRRVILELVASGPRRELLLDLTSVDVREQWVEVRRIRCDVEADG